MISPGSHIGMLGGGQLGRMFAMAAQQTGYYVHVFTPESNSPCGQVSTLETAAPFDDEDALVRFAQSVDVVTYEFENVPLSAIEIILRHADVAPGPHVLKTTQNRRLEKEFLTSAGVPQTPHAFSNSRADLERVLDDISGTSVVKTVVDGYDGKGQMAVRSAEDRAMAVDAFESREVVVEQAVDIQWELSVVGSRSYDGSIELFGPLLNHHRNHILDVSIAPAPQFSSAIRDKALEISRTLLEQLDVTGVLTVEFFLSKDDRLLVNELAPRPHNSGHLTIEACRTSQFQQQMRAICRLPLGSMEQIRPAVMANLLGSGSAFEPQRIAACLHQPNLSLHLYGKREYREGRKIGHITLTGNDVTELESSVRKVRDRLYDSSSAEGSAAVPLNMK